ncbi:magnesium transporter CorA family protein [Bacteroidota bacterium]
MEIFYFDGKGVTSTDNLNSVNKNKLTWIRFLDQSEDKIKEFSEFTGIPEEEFKEFFETEERSRLEQGKFLELTYQTPFRDKDEIGTIPINFFIINNMLITVERNKTKVLEQAASQLKQKKLKFLFRRSIGDMLSYFLDKINDDFLTSIDRIANLTDVLESKGQDVSNEQLMKLYNYNVTLTHFNQAIIANLEVLGGLRKSYFKKFTKENLQEFAELYYDKLQILDTEKIQREVITNLFNFQTVVATHKLNNFMKRLTTLALIFVIPTLITGLFGMNVNIPFGNHPYGFLIVFLIIVLFVGGMLFMFKKLDWL